MRRLLAFLLTVLTTLTLSACMGIQPATPSTDSTPAASSEATGSMSGMDHGSMDMDSAMPFDAMFIDSMIEHHQGAIDMAEMAREQADHEEVRVLAETIITEQQAEIEQMQSWRSEWYPDLAATTGMDMSMGDMAIREEASTSFDQRFLEAMISHHQGAIGMAEMTLNQAEHEELRALAEVIITDQQAEIEQMQTWLAQWYDVGK